MGDVCFSFVVMMFYFFRWMKMNMIIFLMEAEMVEMAMLVMLVLRRWQAPLLMAFPSEDGLLAGGATLVWVPRVHLQRKITSSIYVGCHWGATLA